MCNHLYYELVHRGLPGTEGCVAFFFVLSGFVLCQGYAERYMSGYAPSYQSFMVKRFKRVFPLHWACCLLFLVFVGNLTVGSLIEMRHQFMLVQSWIPVSEIYYSGNSVSWFLSDILFCYAMFPIVVRGVFAPVRRVVPMAIVVLLSYFAVVHSVSDKDMYYVLYVSPFMRLLDFVLGMFVWRIYRAHGGLIFKSNVLRNIAETSVVVIFLLMCFFQNFVPERFTLASYWWPAVAGLVLVFAQCGSRRDSLARRLLQHPAMLWLGGLSFNIYMVHFIVIWTYMRYIDSVPYGHKLIVLIPTVFTSTIAVAWLLNRYVEKWFNDRRLVASSK